MRAGQLLLFSGQQHSRNKYIYSYTPNREEQRNLTGKQFQTDIFYNSLSFPPLSLQTKQLLCTPKTQERATRPVNDQSRAGTFSALFLFSCERPFLLPVRCGQLPLSGPPTPPPSSYVRVSLLLVRRVVRRLGGREGREREGEREEERGGGGWRMEGGRAA